MLRCFTLRGQIGDAMLVGPGLVEFEFERDGRTVHPVDLDGQRPEAVVQRRYDLVFPMTAIPLGELRRRCPDWRTNRRLRPVGVLPFLWLGQDKVWAKHSEEFLRLFRVDRIYALLPRIELWSKRFDEWTEEDWKTCGLSALWDIKTGQVLWAHGAHDIAAMRQIGKPIEEFLKSAGEGARDDG